MSKLMKAVAVLVLGVVVFSVAARAQEKSAVNTTAPKDGAATNVNTPVYKVEFVIAEVEDGKRVNARTYTLMMEEGKQARANASTRVPVPTGPPISGPGVNSLVNTQFNYMDVGLSLTFRFVQQGDYLMMSGGYNIDTFAMPDEAQGGNALHMPVTRRISSDVGAAILPGKPTIISSVDDTNSKRRYQLEVTATKVK